VLRARALIVPAPVVPETAWFIELRFVMTDPAGAVQMTPGIVEHAEEPSTVF
jgi:hypothetical protein